LNAQPRPVLPQTSPPTPEPPPPCAVTPAAVAAAARRKARGDMVVELVVVMCREGALLRRTSQTLFLNGVADLSTECIFFPSPSLLAA
jgi:hypothetical protein